jgi:hypothetical protein
MIVRNAPTRRRAGIFAVSAILCSILALPTTQAARPMAKVTSWRGINFS